MNSYFESDCQTICIGPKWEPLNLSKMAHLKNVGTQNNNLSESDIHYIRKMQDCQTDILTINYVCKTSDTIFRFMLTL